MDYYLKKNYIKVYQIDLNHYELASLGNHREKINLIIDYHKENFKSTVELQNSYSESRIGDIDYYLYVFNEVEKESLWKKFLPDSLTRHNQFSIQSTSFSLFIHCEGEIFVIIGGRGLAVISRHMNHYFGLDLYEKISDPAEDIVHSQQSRGITGNLTAEQRTYRNEQRLMDSLSIGRVPKKLNLLLRQELKDSLFEFMSFEPEENTYLELGSSFCIKTRIDFDQTHQLIKRIREIQRLEQSRPLSRFERILDKGFSENELLMSLKMHIRDDMVRINTPDSNWRNNLDYDFVHPQKLNAFYECDLYKVFLKGAKTPILETRDRRTLYVETLKRIFPLVDPYNEWDFIKTLSGTRVRGYNKEEVKTEAMFLNHISCELEVDRKPYFFIDNNWYKVRGDFIDSLNNECETLLKSNEFNSVSLLPWHSNLTEGEYNLLYDSLEGFLVLDKSLGQNIELCDLLYETKDILYLIHVKEGFDAKIRDLTNQVLISATRLWNDLKSDREFLSQVYQRFILRRPEFAEKMSFDAFSMKFNKDIIFVLAFCQNNPKIKVSTHIQDFKSNIAKFSIIQTMREMQVDNYSLKIIELERKKPEHY